MIQLSPLSIQTMMKAKLAEDGKISTTDRRLMMENGHPGVEIDEAAIRRGENPYTKYYQQQGEHPLPSGGQVSLSATYTRILANLYTSSHSLSAISRLQSQCLVHLHIGGRSMVSSVFDISNA